MNNQPQQPKQPASRERRTQGGDQTREEGHSRNDSERVRDGRPKADPELTRRFEKLDEALHGKTTKDGPRSLVWNGVNQPAVTFESIESQLKPPEARPPSDLPEQSDVSHSGG